jgi:glycosyltransferase involved in cell wall biosynthesis
MSKPGQIIFLGDYLFPEGDGAAIRTLSLARICRDLGFTVTVIGKGRVRPQDYDNIARGYYIDGIHYQTMNPERVFWPQRLRHPIERLRQSVRALEQLDLADTRAIIINASGSARHVPFVHAFCRTRSIPLIGDVCEWYDPRQMKLGLVDPSYALFYLAFRYVFPRLRNLIVVSTLLERHFAGAGRNLLRISAPVDVREIPCTDRTGRDRLVLLYAGQPGRKDLIQEVFVALASLAPQERSRVEFRLMGPTSAELAKILGKSAGLLDLLGDSVKPLGRAPRHQVLAALQEAHFTVLLRPQMRYANAGFPGKVPESLAAGTPILLNFTSDLEEYLGDGTAALPVRDCSAAAVAEAIRRALALGPVELQEFRRCARLKAERHFDYRLYLDSFSSYLETLR